MSDGSSEEFAFPYLFPKGKLGYKVDTEFTLSPVKYFKQWLLTVFNCTHLFAPDPDYMLFLRVVTQKLKLQCQTNVAVKKFPVGT